MVRNVSPLVRQLESEDFHLLSGIEHGMRFSEWVDKNKLPRYSGLDAENVEHRTDRCLRFELIERKTIQYEGYRLRFEGYDALALHAFAERGSVSEVGAPLGEGKESDVFEARNRAIVALKFHREGLTNFRTVRRAREYTADRAHVSWLYTARKAAEREFEVLESLYPNVAVPKPIDQNRHAIVMEKMDGAELSGVSVTADLVLPIAEAILSELATAYEMGYIHADASEYNVFMTEEGVTIFDWPQAVAVDHPNADVFLERDLQNIVSFFRRKHPRASAEIPDIGEIGRQIRENRVQL